MGTPSGLYPNEQVIEVFGEQVKWPGLGSDGKFTNGSFTDPLVKPSFIPAETLNLLLDNMQKAIEGAGLKPNNIEPDQLAKAFQAFAKTSAGVTLTDAAESDALPTTAANTAISVLLQTIRNNLKHIFKNKANKIATLDGVDFNTITEFGNYVITNSNTNAPASNTGNWKLFVYGEGGTVIQDCVYGSATPGSGKRWWRKCENGTWLAWQRYASIKTATFVVGSASSRHTLQDVDYLCTGANDHNQINAAIAALPANGGKIVLLEGVYNIESSIIVNKPNIVFEGMGMATILQKSNQAVNRVIHVTASDCKISNLAIDGNKAAYNSYTNGINNTGSRCQIFQVTSNNNTGSGITNTGSDCIISQAMCNNNLYTGIFSSGNGCIISQAICNNNFTDGIILNDSFGTCVVGSNIKYNSRNGIYLWQNANHNLIQGNLVFGHEASAIELSNESSFNSIAGNICKDNGEGFVTSSSNTYGKCNTIVGNTFMRGDGLTADYTSAQYTIRLAGGTYNLIAYNNIPGKNYVNYAGATNTFTNNKYN